MATKKNQRRSRTDAEIKLLAEKLYQQVIAQEVLSLKTSDQRLWTRVLQLPNGQFFCQLLAYNEDLGRYKWIWTYEEVDTQAPAEETARLWINNYERDLRSGKFSPMPLPNDRTTLPD